MSDAAIIAVCTLLGGILGALLPEIAKLLGGKKKGQADLATTYEEMARKQADQINAMRSRLDELECRIDEYETGIRILLAQLVENGHKPRWTPKPHKAEATP